MGGSLPDEKEQRKWEDFVLLLRFQVLRKVMRWEFLKLSLNLPPSTISTASARQKPGGMVHNEPDKLNHCSGRLRGWAVWVLLLVGVLRLNQPPVL